MCIKNGETVTSVYFLCEKGHPRRGHEGPEGEYNYSSTLSLTSTLVEVVGVTSVQLFTTGT